MAKRLTRKKWARTRIGRKRSKERCAKQLNATHQPNQVEETPPGDEGAQEPNKRRSKGNEDVARLSRGECHGPYFRRVLECSRIFHNALEPSGIHQNAQECSKIFWGILESFRLF